MRRAQAPAQAPLVEQLGRFVAGAARRPLPAEIASQAARRLLDALGLAVQASDEHTVRAATAAITRVPAQAGTAALWAGGGHAVPSEAVLVNAIAAHAHFQDDMDAPSWTHPGSLVVPAALGAAAHSRAELGDVLRGIAVGYAVLAWIGAMEAVPRALIARGFRVSPTLGTIGAAAAAASVMQLDARAAAHALAIACNMTGGLLEPVAAGADDWRLQNGQAARMGYLAAAMAAGGVQGAPSALEGERGFLRAIVGLSAVPRELAQMPSLDAVGKVAVKPWPTSGGNIGACAAALALVEKGVAARDIASGRIAVWKPFASYPGAALAGPFGSAAQAQISTPYSVAAMLLHGELCYDMFLPAGRSAALRRLAGALTLEPLRVGDRRDARIVLTLRNGKTVSAQTPASLDRRVQPDEDAVAATFDARLAAAGRAPASGARLARAVFGAARTGRGMRLARLLDAVTGAPRAPRPSRRSHATAR